jgi:hypothetical protein
MTGLLPNVVRDGLAGSDASQNAVTFGLVAVVLLIVVMVAAEALRADRAENATAKALSAVTTPLLLCVFLLVGVRIAALLP